MPTYEYLCKGCSHRFETWQKMTDQPLTICPQCGGLIRRVLFPAGVVFKGSGFYKTDHTNGTGENGHAPKSDETAKAGETATTSSSGESKSSSDTPGSADTGSAAGARKSESKAAVEAK